MTSALQIFNNDEFTIRTVNEDGEIWFVAKDIAEALEYSEATIKNNIRNLTQSVPEIWKGNKRIITLGGEQEMLCLSEQGLYFFLGRSDKPKAFPYQFWIANDVVPNIRKTGNYITNPTPAINNSNDSDIALKRAAILQHMLDNPNNYPIPEESKAVIAHEIFKFTTGHECLAMLPEATEARYTATELGKMFGVSANKIGRIAKKYGLQSKKGEPSEYGRWICDKSRYSSRECMTFVYNDKALEWSKDFFNTHKPKPKTKERK